MHVHTRSSHHILGVHPVYKVSRDATAYSRLTTEQRPGLTGGKNFTLAKNLLHRSLSHRAWSMEHGAWDMEHGAWGMEHGY